MPTKSSRHASASRPAAESAADPTSMMAPLNMLSGVTCQQASLMTEAACAMLDSSEALSRIQQQAAHQACMRHQAAAETLRATVEPLDALAIQSDLLRQNVQEVAQYWAQLASAAMKTQFDLMSRMTEILGSGSPNGLGAAIDAWKTAVSASTETPAGRVNVH